MILDLSFDNMSGLAENPNVPVVLVCDGEFIAVPLHVLVKESTVFKSMFSSNWRGATVNESSSGQVYYLETLGLCKICIWYTEI